MAHSRQELLAAAGLSQAGKKDELITRLLDGGASAPADVAVEVTSNEAPNAPALEASALAPVAVQDVSASIANDSVPADATVPEAGAQPAPVVAEVSAEEKAAALKAEQDKRDARAARFGQAAPSKEVKATDEEEAAKVERAKKYGTGKKEVGPLGIEKASSPPPSNHGATRRCTRHMRSALFEMVK